MKSLLGQKSQENLRWNFAANVLDIGSYRFGLSFSSPVTILPLFLSHLTTSPLAIGLISTIQRAGWMLPPLLVANYSERLPLKKALVVSATINERVPFLFLALIAFQLSNLSASTALICFFVLYTWCSVASGASANAWQEMIAKVIPKEIRGTFFGIQQGFGGLLAAGGAALAGVILQKFPYPINFTICFSISFVVLITTCGFVAATREPAIVSSKPRLSQRDYFRRIPSILQKDKNFTCYLVSRGVSTLANVATGFFSVYAVRFMSVTSGEIGLLSSTWMLAETIANPLLGLLGDRKGHKAVLEIANLCSTAACAIVLIAPSTSLLYLAFAFAGAGFAGSRVSGMSIVMDFVGPEERPTYMALSSTLVAPLAGIGPIVGGWLAWTFGFGVLFAAALGLALGSSVLLRWTVREPCKRATGSTKKNNA